VNGALEAGDRHFTQDLGIPKSVRIEQAPQGKNLSAMLAAGELDALVIAAAPSTLRAPNVARLFRDYRRVEREYFRKSGVFPIMHVIGIKTELLDADTSLATRVYRAFCKAKDICMRNIEGDGGAVKTALPWLGAELDATRAIMGEDYWPYGVDRNRKTLEAATRWSFEQHLSPRKLGLDELFAPETVGVPA
jgi:4,5-dihydroxyphthalate decarboxylase